MSKGQRGEDRTKDSCHPAEDHAEPQHRAEKRERQALRLLFDFCSQRGPFALNKNLGAAPCFAGN
ncbi:MAG: hypothetical protein LAN64_17875 [Acidobacteriia bacterium]|nr:hypothetical protein [Terriglobia bacterium]